MLLLTKNKVLMRLSKRHPRKGGTPVLREKFFSGPLGEGEGEGRELKNNEGGGKSYSIRNSLQNYLEMRDKIAPSHGLNLELSSTKSKEKSVWDPAEKGGQRLDKPKS